MYDEAPKKRQQLLSKSVAAVYFHNLNLRFKNKKKKKKNIQKLAKRFI